MPDSFDDVPLFDEDEVPPPAAEEWFDSEQTD